MSDGQIFALAFVFFIVVPISFYFVWAMTSDSERGIGLLVHKTIPIICKISFAIFLFVSAYFIFIENYYQVLIFLFLFLLCLFPNSFHFFFIRPRQKKLDRQYSQESLRFQSELRRASRDVDFLISSLGASDLEVSVSRDIACRKYSFDPEFLPRSANPRIVSTLVPFMRRQEALTPPVRETFQPTSTQRRVGFAVHILLSLVLAAVLFFLSAPLRADRSASDDPSPASVSDTVEERNYVASVNSDKFHIPSCRHAANISDENRVYYSTRSKARSDGKSPCSVCDP